MILKAILEKQPSSKLKRISDVESRFNCIVKCTAFRTRTTRKNVPNIRLMFDRVKHGKRKCPPFVTALRNRKVDCIQVRIIIK